MFVKKKAKQAEAEVVPSSSFVEIKVEVEVKVEVGVEVEVGVGVEVKVGVEGEVGLKGEVGVEGGWLEKTGLRLSHLQSLSLS